MCVCVCVIILSGGAVENVGLGIKNSPHTKKILIVEPLSESCKKKQKHFTTKHKITKCRLCLQGKPASNIHI